MNPIEVYIYYLNTLFFLAIARSASIMDGLNSLTTGDFTPCESQHAVETLQHIKEHMHDSSLTVCHFIFNIYMLIYIVGYILRTSIWLL